MSEKVIPAGVAEKLLRRARKAGQTSEEAPSGWSRIFSGPEKILAVFKPLRLKTGFMLTGYRFVEGGNGNGFVYAVPKEIEVPDPDQCQKDHNRFLSPPVPPSALEDVMDAIVGDGSPLSYLCASLLKRELEEFGAMWHGCSWGTHELVTQHPFAQGGCLWRNSGDDDQTGSGNVSRHWEWLKPKPSRWEPRVKMKEDNVTVTFHTHSEYLQRCIYRHADRYKPGGYRFKNKQTIILQGAGGYVF